METRKNLRVGYARQVITPDYPVCISGYGDDEIRRSQGVVDDLYLTCIAVTEGDDTVLMYTADLLSINGAVADQARAGITEATGIPGDKVFFGATHSHSGPALYGDQPDAARFRAELLAAAVSVARSALDDRTPAAMLSTVQELKGINFIRHYKMKDGSYAGSNFGDWTLGIVGHANETDPRMVLIQFRREGKKDIVLMNWQAHNDNVFQVGYYFLSSSYTGHIRAAFEEATGMHFAYFTGAGGNQNRDSRIPEEKHNLNWIEYGHKMAEYAVQALPTLTPVTGSGIQTKRVMFEYEIDHSWDHMLEQANEVFHVWKTVGKEAGDALGKTYGFTSSYQSRDIRRRANMPATDFLELNAFRIGDMGFITSTNEVFSTVGIHVRANSPFETTFIITGNSGYLPCAAAYDYRSYEADTSVFAKGTAEKVADEFVRMLESVK